MAIESNGEPIGSAPKPSSTFERAEPAATTTHTHAPLGSNDFRAISSVLGLNSIDSIIAPYLEKVTELIQGDETGISRYASLMVPNGYSIRYDGPDGIASFYMLLFTQTTAPRNPNFTPPSGKFITMAREIRKNFGDNTRIVEGSVVLADSIQDMQRAQPMADSILRKLRISAVPQYKNLDVGTLQTSEFVVDTSISNVRAAVQGLSPNGVAPRVDIGLVLNYKINNGLGREFAQEEASYDIAGVIGAYVSFYEKEQRPNAQGQMEWRFQPVIKISALASPTPHEGMGALLIAAFAQCVTTNPQFWLNQWKNVGVEGMPNPGHLELDPANPGQPYSLMGPEELAQFAAANFAPPVIAYQYLEGRDNIPGMYAMTSPSEHDRANFIERVNHYFRSDAADGQGMELSRQLGVSFEGVTGDAKGNLSDSRLIDYLDIAAKAGFATVNDPATRAILLGAGAPPQEMCKLIDMAAGNFVPLFSAKTDVLNPALIEFFARKVATAHLTIVDPNAGSQVRPIGSLLNGFGALNAGFTGIIANGIAGRTVNAESFQYFSK